MIAIESRHPAVLGSSNHRSTIHHQRYMGELKAQQPQPRNQIKSYDIPMDLIILPNCKSFHFPPEAIAGRQAPKQQQTMIIWKAKDAAHFVIRCNYPE